MRSLSFRPLFGLCLLASACSLAPFDPVIGSPDATPVDAGRVDASRGDAGDLDAGDLDAGDLDAGDSSNDGGNPSEDGGAPDAMVERDAGEIRFEADCLNGVDDDGDELPDCADPDCIAIGYRCVDRPDDGMFGGRAIFGQVRAGASECPGRLALGSVGTRAPDVICDACSCGEPADPSCAVEVSAYGIDSCAAVIDTLDLDPLAASSCQGLPLGTDSLDVTNEVATATCAVAGASPPAVLSAPDILDGGETLTVCPRLVSVGGGCSAEQVCVAGTSTGSAPLCVVREGNAACSDALPWRRRVVREREDRRGCGECECTTEGGCTYELALWGEPDCGEDRLGTLGASCSTLPLGSQAVSLSGESAFSCGASGGAPGGCAAETDAVTVCCEPEAGPSCPVGPGPPMVLIETSRGSFCIDSTPVTNAQYRAFVESDPDRSAWGAGCEDFSDLTPSDYPDLDDDQLVFPTRFCHAYGYCAWAGKRLCGEIGDPTPTIGVLNDPERGEWVHACTAGDSVDRDTSARCGNASAGDRAADVASDPCCVVDGVFDMGREWSESDGRLGEWGPRSSTGAVVFGSRSDCAVVGGALVFTEQPLGIRCCSDPIMPPGG